MLEMIPLAQASSIESSSAGGEDLGLQGVSLEPLRAAGHNADDDAPGRNEPVDGGSTGGAAEDSQEETRRLLSSPRGDREQLDSTGKAGRTHALGSFHGHVEGLRGSGGVEGFDLAGSGAESRRLGRRGRRRSACWQECLMPAKLLQDKRTRAIIFVYAVFSVSRGAVPPPSPVQISSQHEVIGPLLRHPFRI